MIALASDHGGFALKQDIMAHLDSLGLKYKDFGCYDTSSCDYPDYAEPACIAVNSGEADKAILICSTGIGISIAANKVNGIRAALCTNEYMAKYTRMHNNANVLCLGAKVIGQGVAEDIVDVFLNTEFEGGRHERRVSKIADIEARQK